MYLRRSVRRKDGKEHVYWRLVRSVRRGREVRQETVAQLGELDATGRAKAAALGRHVMGQGDQQRCGGRMKIIATVRDPQAVRKILTCVGLPARPPPVAPAREREQADLSFGQ